MSLVVINGANASGLPADTSAKEPSVHTDMVGSVVPQVMRLRGLKAIVSNGGSWRIVHNYQTPGSAAYILQEYRRFRKRTITDHQVNPLSGEGTYTVDLTVVDSQDENLMPSRTWSYTQSPAGSTTAPTDGGYGSTPVFPTHVVYDSYNYPDWAVTGSETSLQNTYSDTVSYRSLHCFVENEWDFSTDLSAAITFIQTLNFPGLSDPYIHTYQINRLLSDLTGFLYCVRPPKSTETPSLGNIVDVVTSVISTLSSNLAAIGAIAFDGSFYRLEASPTDGWGSYSISAGDALGYAQIYVLGPEDGFNTNVVRCQAQNLGPARTVSVIEVLIGEGTGANYGTIFELVRQVSSFSMAYGDVYELPLPSVTGFPYTCSSSGVGPVVAAGMQTRLLIDATASDYAAKHDALEVSHW